MDLVNHKDIQIFSSFVANPFYCSSLRGKRAIDDVFGILDNAVSVGSSNAFVLQEIDDRGTFLPTLYERGAAGTFKPGKYVIVPQENGVEVFRRDTKSFTSGLGEVPRQKVSDASTEGSAVSIRDDGLRGFKMRLVYRDKGCVVCHAEGTPSVYEYRDDSQFFEGSHIFPFARQSAWSLRGFQNLITDPYTTTSKENTTRNRRDPLRIDSLENGMLLCLSHHKAYDILRFSIHPTTHEIFAFHPAVAHLHGLKVISPWKDSNPILPGPHHDLLRAHYETSIFASLSAAAEPLDDDDDDDDDDELPEFAFDHNEVVGIWTNDSNRYPPVDGRLDNEERDSSTPAVKDVELPPSGSQSCAVF